MSAVQTSDRYRVADTGWGVCRGFKVFDDRGRSMDGAPMFVDSFRTSSAAKYAAHLLNAGVAHVDPHGIIGCRVVAEQS